MSKRSILLLLGLVHGVSGIAAGRLTPGSREQGLVGIALGVAFVIAIYAWCRAELTTRGLVLLFLLSAVATVGLAGALTPHPPAVPAPPP